MKDREETPTSSPPAHKLYRRAPANRILFFGMVALLAAFFVGRYNWNLWRKTKATFDWPVTVGEVTRSHSKRVTNYARRGATTTTFYPEVDYHYEVDGRTYQGKRIRLEEVSFGTDAKSKQLLSDLIEDDQVQVYYDSSAPGISLLIPGMSWKRKCWGIVYAIVFYGTAFILLSMGLSVHRFVNEENRRLKTQASSATSFETEPNRTRP